MNSDSNSSSNANDTNNSSNNNKTLGRCLPLDMSERDVPRGNKSRRRYDALGGKDKYTNYD